MSAVSIRWKNIHARLFCEISYKRQVSDFRGFPRGVCQASPKLCKPAPIFWSSAFFLFLVSAACSVVKEAPAKEPARCAQRGFDCQKIRVSCWWRFRLRWSPGKISLAQHFAIDGANCLAFYHFPARSAKVLWCALKINRKRLRHHIPSIQIGTYVSVVSVQSWVCLPCSRLKYAESLSKHFKLIGEFQNKQVFARVTIARAIILSHLCVLLF